MKGTYRLSSYRAVNTLRLPYNKFANGVFSDCDSKAVHCTQYNSDCDSEAVHCTQYNSDCDSKAVHCTQYNSTQFVFVISCNNMYCYRDTGDRTLARMRDGQKAKTV